MKKVLSIMLAAMMLVSLFAVSASASVATYEGYEVKTILAESANVKSAMPYIRNKVATSDASRAVSSFATVGEGEDANEVAILKYSADGQEWLFGSSQAILTPYEKLVFTFDVNVVNCASGLQIGFNTGAATTSFVISPATFMGGQMTASGANAQVEDADSLNLNQWYNFRVTVDKSVFAAAATIDETVRRNAMTIEWKKAEDEKFAIMPYITGGYFAYKVGARADATMPSWTQTGVAISPNANSWMVCVDAEGNALKSNVEYHIDNVKLIGRMPKVTYPTTGVLVAEDFEGTSPEFVGGQGTLVGDETNKYLDFYRSDTVNTNTYGASKEFKPASLPQEFVVTADIYKETDNTQNLFIELFTDTLGVTDANGKLVAGAAGNIILDESKFETGKWYTVKVARLNKVYPIVTVVDKETGETQNFSATTRANVSGSTSYNRLLFRALNTAGSISHWRIDNVMVAEAGAASIISTTVDETTGATTVKFDVDAKAYTATPVLATFAGDRLVAADFADVTLSADGAEVDLVPGGEYDEAVLYLWNGLGGAPFMEAWDITDSITVAE